MEEEKLFTIKDFINTGTNTFIDISSELRRTYTFDSFRQITIAKPLLLCVKDNGHRVWDAYGVSHYIPTGWFHLMWIVRDGEANFVK